MTWAPRAAPACSPATSTGSLRESSPGYELATADRLWRHFLDDAGTITVDNDHVRVDLAPCTYTPVLIDAGFPGLEIPIHWWADGGSTSASHAEPNLDRTTGTTSPEDRG